MFSRIARFSTAAILALGFGVATAQQGNPCYFSYTNSASVLYLDEVAGTNFVGIDYYVSTGACVEIFSGLAWGPSNHFIGIEVCGKDHFWQPTVSWSDAVSSCDVGYITVP